MEKPQHDLDWHKLHRFNEVSLEKQAEIVSLVNTIASFKCNGFMDKLITKEIKKLEEKIQQTYIENGEKMSDANEIALEAEMNKADRQEAELNQELEQAEDIAINICNVITELKYYLDDYSSVDLDFTTDSINITIELSEVELEAFMKQLKTSASKLERSDLLYVLEKVGVIYR